MHLATDHTIQQSTNPDHAKDVKSSLLLRKRMSGETSWKKKGDRGHKKSCKKKARKKQEKKKQNKE